MTMSRNTVLYNLAISLLVRHETEENIRKAVKAANRLFLLPLNAEELEQSIFAPLGYKVPA
jgi:hypothetical protein